MPLSPPSSHSPGFPLPSYPRNFAHAATGGSPPSGTGAWGDPIYQSAVSADWQSSRMFPSPYGVFQEMEDKDAHLFSALQTRKLAVLAGGWTLEPGDPTDPQSLAALQLVRRVLDHCPDFEALLLHLLDALGKGLALAELEWEISPQPSGPPLVAPRRIVGQWPGDFAFDDRGQLHRLQPYSDLRPTPRVPSLLPRPGEAMRPFYGVPVPARKIVPFAFQGSPAQPYGTSLCLKTYWYVHFKRHTLKYWTLFNERFGSPTAVARYGPEATPTEISQLESLLDSLQTDSGIVLPEGTSLELLEAGRSSSGSTHRDLADWCNDEISKAVLGQTLTTGEGRRSGSLALGRIHNEVRREYIAADARALACCVSTSLLRWITDFNLGPAVASPRLRLGAERPSDPTEDLALDERLVRLGVPLPMDWFHSRYGRPVPESGQRVLRYDDANLYQYHLQFGVLKINEVRASLGLEPVPWGDVPPQMQPGQPTHPGPSRSGPGADQRDGDRSESDQDEGHRDRRIR